MLEEIYCQDIIGSLDDSVHIPLEICKKHTKVGIKDSFFNNGSTEIIQIFSIWLFLVLIFNRIQEIILNTLVKAVLFGVYSLNALLW